MLDTPSIGSASGAPPGAAALGDLEHLFAQLARSVAEGDRQYSDILNQVLNGLAVARNDCGEPAPCLIEAPESPRQPCLHGEGEPFLAMAAEVERSLVSSPPNNSVLALGLRFDELERKVRSFVENAPPAPQAEASAAQAQRSRRYERIESLLSHVVERLSDERLSEVFEKARVFASVQDRAAVERGSLTGVEIEALSERMDELCVVVDRMIEDHRRANGAAAVMMATLQDALARVLSRIEETRDAPLRAEAPAAHSSAQSTAAVGFSERGWPDAYPEAKRMAGAFELRPAPRALGFAKGVHLFMEQAAAALPLRSMAFASVAALAAVAVAQTLNLAAPPAMTVYSARPAASHPAPPPFFSPETESMPPSRRGQRPGGYRSIVVTPRQIATWVPTSTTRSMGI